MISEPFQISVDDKYRFEAMPGDAQRLDVIADGKDRFHLLYNGKSYHVEVAEAHHATRAFTLRVNGSQFTVKVADHYERLVQQLGLNVGGSHKMNTVKAPMPGLVLNILVETGQSVQKGDPLVILEAMKMENVIKAAGDGLVKVVTIRKGAAVDKGQLLLEME